MYDLVVIGGGPGGYVAAIRAAQMGKQVALVEEHYLGGICLNHGCIPTKALLTCAAGIAKIKEASKLGITVEFKGADPAAAVLRAQGVRERLRKGIELLMKKNKITVIEGRGRFCSDSVLSITAKDGSTTTVEAHNFIVATGAQPRRLPSLNDQDARVLNAYQALEMKDLPQSIAIVGAGAIGCEFAYCWHQYGVKVHLFEKLNHLLPLEDDDACMELERAFRRQGIKFSIGIEEMQIALTEDNRVSVTTVVAGKKEQLYFDKILVAIGMEGRSHDLGLEAAGVLCERSFIKTDEFGRTSVPHIFAIGDIAGPPLLAHIASRRGLIAVETIYGHRPRPIRAQDVPGCTYCLPQVASIGYRERELKQQNIPYRVAKIPFLANGKAIASEEKDGFIKVLVSAADDQRLLGAHIVHEHATELIFEYGLVKQNDLSVELIEQAIHPHPTLGEWLEEAIASAQGRSIHT